jgi:hypothetical protein
MSSSLVRVNPSFARNTQLEGANITYAYTATGNELMLTELGVLAEGLNVITVRIIDTGRRSLLPGV